MTTAQKTLAFVAAAVVGYSLLRKGAGLNTLNFYPGGIKDLKFQQGHPVMTAKLIVQNTSNQSFTLKSMAGNLYMTNAGASTLVGNVSLFQSMDIPANSQKVIELRVDMLLIGLLDEIIEAIQTGNFTRILELDSYANVDNLQIPVNIDYKIG